MTAKTRALIHVPTMPAMGQSKLSKLLVSGCSYTWNNSEEHACTWPYYLQDALGFQQVLDCSQCGSGPDLAFNSVINEVLINKNISADDTLISVMWSGLERTDVITSFDDKVKDYHPMSLYAFNEQYCNLTLFSNINDPDDNYSKLAMMYKKTIPFAAQAYQSLLKMIALAALLDHMKFNYVFMTWKPIDKQYMLENHIPENIIDIALSLMVPIKIIDEYADQHDMRIPNDGHPSADCHIHWTKVHLVPGLAEKFPQLINLY